MGIEEIGKRLGDEIPNSAERNNKIMRAWMRTWIKNSTANVGRFKDETSAEHVHSLMELEKLHAGKPAIIVGAGSTLDTVLDNGGAELLRDRGDAILICPNSLTRPMLGRGIEPDYFTALHPTSDVAWCWNRALRTAEPNPMNMSGKKLIAATTIHPQVIDLWLDRVSGDGNGAWNPGDIYLTMQGYDEPMQIVDAVTTLPDGTRQAAARNTGSYNLPSDWYGVAQPAIWNQHDDDPGHVTFPWSKRGQVLPEMPNMGCIVNYSIQVAALLGCSPILLVGCDYSFIAGADGRFRYRCDDWRMVDGKWERQEPDLRQQEIDVLRCAVHTVDGVAGRKVHAHEYHISYRNSCHALCSQFKTPDGELLDVVNCSPDGILTEIPRMGLERALFRAKHGEWWARKDRAVVKPEKVVEKKADILPRASVPEKVEMCIECGSISRCGCANEPARVATEDAAKIAETMAHAASLTNDTVKNLETALGACAKSNAIGPLSEEDIAELKSRSMAGVVAGEKLRDALKEGALVRKKNEDDPAIADDRTDEEQELARKREILCRDIPETGLPAHGFKKHFGETTKPPAICRKNNIRALNELGSSQSIDKEHQEYSDAFGEYVKEDDE